MTATTALIVHALLDSPDRWRDEGDHITDGYHKIAFHGGTYSMGSAQYHSDPADAESFRRALAEWKRVTGWHAPNDAKAAPAVAPRQVTPMMGIEREAYTDFARAVRSALNSFQIHKDSGILGKKIEDSLDALDRALHPIHRAEGRIPDAKGS